MRRRLSCREFVEFLADYLSGDLAPEQVTAFNEHLARCPCCVSYAQTYREAMRLGKAVLRGDHEPVPDSVPEELIQAILAVRERKS